MNFNKCFNLKIINKNNYKIYYFDLNIDQKTKEAIIPNMNDLNLWCIMTENFFENCKLSNQKFGIIFNLKNLKKFDLMMVTKVCKLFLRYNSLLKSLLIGNCILMNRDNAKLLLNLFLKFYIPVKPIKLTNNIPECYDFLESCFLSKNINNNDIIID